MGDAPDSTVADPEGHRIVFENEHIRVLEIRLPVGTDLPMHSHPPRAIVAAGSYRLESTDPDGDVSVVDRRPGDTIWSPGEEHAARVLAGPVHAVEVELKGLATSIGNDEGSGR